MNLRLFLVFLFLLLMHGTNINNVVTQAYGGNTYSYDFESGWSPCDWNTRFQFSHDPNGINVFINRCDGGIFTRNGIARLQIYNPGTNEWQDYGFSAEASYNQGATSVTFDFDPINERGGTNTQQRYRVVVGEDSNLPTGERRAWVNFFLPSTNSPFNNYTYSTSSSNYECLPNGLVALQVTPQNQSLSLSITTCSGSPFSRNGEAIVYVDSYPYGLSQTYMAGASEITINIDPATEGFPNTQTHSLFVKTGEDGNLQTGVVSFNLLEVTNDTTPPYGSITSPQQGATITGSSLEITANAGDGSNGSGIQNVMFRAYYNNQWVDIGSDNENPYEIVWNIPPNLPSQQIQLGLRVQDNAGNIADNPTTPVNINYVQSISVDGLWLPFSSSVGAVRVSRTGLLYEPDYTAAGIPTIYQSSCIGVTNAFCMGLYGEYHDYGDSRNYTRGAIDFQLSGGVDILSSSAGTVSVSEHCLVMVDTNDGSRILYAHLENVVVSVGDTVQKGQKLGQIDDNPEQDNGELCGVSFGTHLHFAVYQGDVEIKALFNDSSVQAHNSIVRPSRISFQENLYQADGDIGSNYPTGRAGSFFLISGNRYQANSTLTILANNHPIGSVTTDDNGDYSFVMSTPNAEDGGYIISAVANNELNRSHTPTNTGNEALNVRITLDAGAELHGIEGDGSEIVITVPENIALQDIYLPVVIR